MKKIITLLIIAIFYIGMSELAAKQKAEKFCNSIQLGASSDSLLNDAIESGARKSSTNWEQGRGTGKSLNAVYTGFFPGSDFICQINSNDSIVTSKKANLATSLLQ